MPHTFTRRAVLAGSAMLAAAPAQSTPRQIVISSENGLRACARAMEILKAGGDTLDAVIAGVNINELDPEDTSVGYGGLPNEEGVVELDACVMHGPTRRCGSVASIRGIKTPSRVAKLVMEQTDHIMLPAGRAALRWAMGLPRKTCSLRNALAWLHGSSPCAIPRGTATGAKASTRRRNAEVIRTPRPVSPR
jgi:N4-(beta-N-acetylglucosaminyl)-L-asparaginase